ncbi:hypothetical protein NC651_039821 [Populus alba x Populus x berolinensis]|nr:hypothetical protein NC651_039821 [Populus alba x Populus x berolinensis]
MFHCLRNLLSSVSFSLSLSLFIFDRRAKEASKEGSVEGECSFSSALFFCFLRRSDVHKQDREEGGEEEDPVDVSKAVGEAGKGLVKSVLFSKADELSLTLLQA